MARANNFKTVIDLRGSDRDNQWLNAFGGGSGQGTLGPKALNIAAHSHFRHGSADVRGRGTFIETVNDETMRPILALQGGNRSNGGSSRVGEFT